MKKYLFKADNGQIKVSFLAKNDQEAFIKLGSIVQEVSRFDSFRIYKIKK